MEVHSCPFRSVPVRSGPFRLVNAPEKKQTYLLSKYLQPSHKLSKTINKPQKHPI